LDRLSSVASGDILADLAAALEEAEKMGLANTAEALAAVAKMDRLKEEQAVVDDLVRLTASATTATQQQLSRVIAQAMRMGLNTKYPEKMAAAKTRAKVLGEEVQFTMKVEVAFRNNDIGAMKEAIAEASAANIPLVFGQKKLQELENRQQVTAALEAAIGRKNKEEVTQLLQQAVESGLHNETVNQAKLFVDRAGLETKIYADFQVAESQMNLQALNSALETAIQLGLRTPEVERAQQARARLEVFDNAASDISAAVQVVVVKLESGISESD